jgi:hypothetical protein
MRKIGQAVVTLNVSINNGTNEHPGVITRVWGQNDGDLVNASVFPDTMPQVVSASSIALYENKSAAVAASLTGDRAAYLHDDL